MFTGKQFPAAAEAGGDLIGYQQQPVAIAQRPHLLQIARMVKAHPARTLHNRLEDHRGNVAMVLLRQPGEVAEIGIIPCISETALRRSGKQMLRQIATPQAVH